MFLCDLTSSNNIVMFWFLLWITRIMTESHLAWNEQHWDTASPKLAEQLEKAIRAGSSSSGGVRQLTPIPAAFQANSSMSIYPQALTREQQPTPEHQGSPETCTTLPGLFCLHPAVRDLARTTLTRCLCSHHHSLQNYSIFICDVRISACSSYKPCSLSGSIGGLMTAKPWKKWITEMIITNQILPPVYSHKKLTGYLVQIRKQNPLVRSSFHSGKEKGLEWWFTMMANISYEPKNPDLFQRKCMTL